MAFPADPILLIKYTLKTKIPGDLTIVGRMLRPEDPHNSIGVFPVSWSPEEESMEMQGLYRPAEPTLQTYLIGIQAMVKGYNEEEGLAQHSDLAARVRAVLYRDEDLRIALRALQSHDGLATEVPKRFGIRNQQFINNDVRGNFIFLSVLDFFMETEITNG